MERAGPCARIRARGSQIRAKPLVTPKFINRRGRPGWASGGARSLGAPAPPCALGGEGTRGQDPSERWARRRARVETTESLDPRPLPERAHTGAWKEVLSYSNLSLLSKRLSLQGILAQRGH